MNFLRTLSYLFIYFQQIVLVSSSKSEEATSSKPDELKEKEKRQSKFILFILSRTPSHIYYPPPVSLVCLHFLFLHFFTASITLGVLIFANFANYTKLNRPKTKNCTHIWKNNSRKINRLIN